MRGNVEIIEPRLFAGVVADEIVASINDSISERGRCALALAGGRTPGIVYRMLSKPGRVEEVEWPKVECYLGDERWVPVTDNQSNLKMVKETLLHDLPKPGPVIHAVNTAAQTPEIGAREYEALLKSREGDAAVFDLVLLGVGEDGHTASIFPLSPLLSSGSGVYSAVVGPSGKGDRISITPSAIIAARKVIFIVRGEGKAEIMARIGSGAGTAEEIPALLSEKSTGKVTWFVDSEAAQRMSR
jgi:6-phosphogluconolactonase